MIRTRDLAGLPSRKKDSSGIGWKMTSCKGVSEPQQSKEETELGWHVLIGKVGLSHCAVCRILSSVYSCDATGDCGFVFCGEETGWVVDSVEWHCVGKL